MKTLISLIVISIAFLQFSCDENNDPKAEQDRVVYLAVNDAIPSSEFGLGLHYYSIINKVYGKLVNHSVGYISSVGDNGIITFDYEITENRLFGRCEDGSVAAVPLPKADGFKYELIGNPRIELTKDGHNVGLFFKVIDLNSENPQDYSLILYKFNCKTGQSGIVNLQDLIKAHDGGIIPFKYLMPNGSTLLINEDFSKAWFVISFISESGSNLGYKIYKLDGSELKGISSLESSPINLLGLDYESYKPIVSMDNNVYTFTEKEGFEENQIQLHQILSSKQFSKTLAEVVVWSDFGLEILSPINGASLKRLFSNSEIIDKIGPNYHMDKSKIVSISTDGDYIVFGLEQLNSNGIYDYFGFDRFQLEISPIFKKAPFSLPSISPKYDLR